MSSEHVEEDIAVTRAMHMGPDAKIDVYLMLKEVDIALTTRRAPDIESAQRVIAKFCREYKMKIPKGYNDTERT